MSRLSQLTADGRVNGIVISVETDTSVAAAFSAWEAQVTSTELANAVTEAIRQMIMNQLQAHPNTEYLVLVGDDRVIPYRRVPDRTRHPESNYTYAGPITTTVGAALQANMTLTDNFYADREFTTWAMATSTSRTWLSAGWSRRPNRSWPRSSTSWVISNREWRIVPQSQDMISSRTRLSASATNCVQKISPLTVT